MAKRKSDYLKMMELGEWLDLFLNEPTEAWRIKKLAKTAVELLDIDYQYSDNDLSFLIIEHLEDVEESVRLKYEDFEERNILWHDQVLYGKDPIKLMDIFDEAVTDFQQHDSFSDLILDPDKINPWLTEDAQEQLFEFFDARRLVGNLFGFILHSKYPWDQTISNILHDANTSNDLLVELANFALSYSQISDQLDFDQGNVRKHRSLASTGDFLKDAPTPIRPFMWKAIISRVFFDFLFLGGEEYFGFCNNCQKFYVVQRKSRKKYCSDSCRVEHFREQHSD